MKFEQRCLIEAGRRELWDFLLNIPQMAACVPGAEEVIATGADRYKGRLRVKLGPIRLKLEGVMVIHERDHEQWRASARSEANDLACRWRRQGDWRNAPAGTKRVHN